LRSETPAEAAAAATPQKSSPAQCDASVSLSRIPVSETAETPLGRCEEVKGLILLDGRRLHRFRAGGIPSSAPEYVRMLLDQPRRHGVVLVADGDELIVVERSQRTLPPETLQTLSRHAGPIIAILRGESRARISGQASDPERVMS